MRSKVHKKYSNRTKIETIPFCGSLNIAVKLYAIETGGKRHLVRTFHYDLLDGMLVYDLLT
jgi:hypothetical protein